MSCLGTTEIWLSAAWGEICIISKHFKPLILRNYTVFYYTETDPDQYAGFGIEGQGYYLYGNSTFNGTVFVYLRDYGNSIKHCEKLCDKVLCTTFTWNKKKSLCSLNKFTPTRKINLSGRMPNPELYSVCYPDRTNCTVPEVWILHLPELSIKVFLILTNHYNIITNTQVLYSAHNIENKLGLSCHKYVYVMPFFPCPTPLFRRP